VADTGRSAARRVWKKAPVVSKMVRAKVEPAASVKRTPVHRRKEDGTRRSAEVFEIVFVHANGERHRREARWEEAIGHQLLPPVFPRREGPAGFSWLRLGRDLPG